MIRANRPDALENRGFNPVLLFLGLFENAKENLTNTKDFFRLTGP